MRVPEDIYIEWVENEAVAYNKASGDVHYLSESAAVVVALIEEEGYEKAKTTLQDRFGTDKTFDEELEPLLESLRARGILSDD